MKRGERGKILNIVFHDKKFVFMMIKKCASVTMGMIILDSLGYTDLTSKNIDNIDNLLNTIPHMNKYEIDALDYTKVVWVRNPFDRLVSGWFNRIHQKKSKYTMAKFGIPRITFSDFIDLVCSIPDSETNTHFMQQTSDITIDGRLVPNVVIKLENIKEEWSKLQKQHTWLADMEYHTHKSNKGDYRTYYTKNLIEKVKIRFKDDFYLLEYIDSI